jgi:hypothetical protein
LEKQTFELEADYFCSLLLKHSPIGHFFTAHHQAFSDVLVEILAGVHKLLTDRLLPPVILSHPVLLVLGNVHENQLDHGTHLFERREVDDNPANVNESLVEVYMAV